MENKSDLEERLEKLEKHTDKLDRHELIMDICISVLTFFVSCVFIAATVAIVAKIVSS